MDCDSKCSLDLMILIIEQSRVETDKLQTEIDSLKGKIKEGSPPKAFDSKLKELQNNIKDFETKVKQMKKFHRDYTSNQVYKCCAESGGKKHLSWADLTLSGSEGDTTEEDGTSSSGEESRHPFLPRWSKPTFQNIKWTPKPHYNQHKT